MNTHLLTSDRATAAPTCQLSTRVWMDGLRPQYASPAECQYDWLMILWDAKSRVVCREVGNNVGSLIDFAEAMIAEGSAEDWELIDLPLARLSSERL